MRDDRLDSTLSGDSKCARFSFWKPEPLPPKDSKILPIELLSLGKIETVSKQLLEIPRMSEMPRAPWEEPSNEKVRMHWECDAGVWLTVGIEKGPPKPGEVLTIEAQSQAPEKMFFKLYVQIFEQFGATVLDEHVHQFFTPREFRTRLAS